MPADDRPAGDAAAPAAPPDGDARLAPPRGPRGPLPDPRRALDTLRAPSRGVVRAVDGIDLTLRRGEVLGAGRRVGSRQDDDRAGHRQADPPDRPARSRSTGEDVSHAVGAERRCATTGGGSSSSSRTRTRRSTRSRRSTTSSPSRSTSTASARRRRSARRGSLAALEAAGLRPAADFACRYPHELSGGQRQRVVIAGRAGHGPGAHRRRRAGLDARRLDPDRAAAADARPAPASAA